MGILNSIPTWIFPVVNHGRERLEQVEFLPFREAIAHGVLGIMTRACGLSSH